MNLPEPAATALLLGTFGVLMALAALFSRTAARIGVPIVLIFLILGMAAGSEGIGGIWFDDYRFAFRAGALALILILWDGGLNTPLASIRAVLAPAGALATLGVLITAGATALCARALGFAWHEALLLGAVVSSTDAAAVFALLRGGGVRLKERVARTIEVESGVNDPMAVILTLMVAQAVVRDQPPGWLVLLTVPLQLMLGAAIGIAAGALTRLLLRRVRLSAAGLYPALTLGIALVAFGLASLAGGSGFIAVYAAAVTLGAGAIPYKSGLARIHDAVAWLAQVAMFLMMGLLVFPSRLFAVAWPAITLALAVAFIARPLATFICLLPFRFPFRETLLIAWGGLRGAAPIILATIPPLYGARGGERVFDVVFFVVVVSAIVPGATIRALARRLGLEEPEPPTPAAALEVTSTRILAGEVLSFYVTPELAVCNASLANVPFPQGSSAILLVRGDQLIACRGDTTLLHGDHIYVICRPGDRPLIELLFGRPQQEAPGHP